MAVPEPVYAAGLKDVVNTRAYDQSALSISDGAASAAVGVEASVGNRVPAAGAESAIIPGLYIVQLADDPVAQYRGGVAGLEAAPRNPARGNRLEVKSPQASAYADHLQDRQAAFTAEVTQQTGIPLLAMKSYRYAFNGFVAKLDGAHLQYLKQHSEVRLIEPVATLPLDTDVGPGFIGAGSIWDGSQTGGPEIRGEGTVIGVIDSGVNWESPSFAEIDVDAYVHINPLGSGNYLGVCASEVTDPDIGPNCNDKLIGAYAKSFDFVQQVNFECADLDNPGNTLGLDQATCTAIAVPLRDYDNALDENGHGSHTASTAGGNRIAIDYLGNAGLVISGVAPRANLIAYDVCHTNSNGQGSCFNIATLAAIEQAVEDGIVDVINYSIGGGAQPWDEANSLAFLAATDAGIFVSASAGNSGPAAGSVRHREPWVSTVAAASHTRGGFNFQYSANGTAVPPASVVDQPLFLGSVGGPHDTAFVNEPVVISPDIDTASDGCAAYPAGTFTGAVAVIRRGTCAFSIKVVNAEAAGAISVIIANNQPGIIIPGVSPAVPFPVFSATEVQSNALRDYVNDPGNAGAATISIPLGAVAQAVPGDVMAGFSSRGPNIHDVLKPDILGPGSNILAAYVGNPTTPSGASDPNAFNIISGTSMSSPHNAGSAALMRALRPNWTVAEIKSALMLTSNRTGITKEDGLTTADPFDRGAGRINLAVAANAGLVLNETGLKFFLADPANGGDPSTLNLPSLQSLECVGTCTWTRRLKSVASVPATYAVSLSGAPGVVVTVVPEVFSINPGQSVNLTITADINGVTPEQFHFGDLLISPIPTSSTPSTVTVIPGAPVAIPDNVYEGGFGGATQGCIDIDTTGQVSGIVTNAELRVAMDHTWIGDLTLKLRSPDGSILGLLSRPGTNEPDDTGNAPTGGDSSDLLATFPITFSDLAITSAEAMGNTITGAQVVCRDDEICEFSPAPGGVAQPPSNLAGFNGENAEGIWTLCGGDSGPGDTGSFTSVTLNLDAGAAADVPTLHMPMAVYAIEPVPEITATPAALSATVQEGGAAQVDTLTLGNVGAVDLDWAVDSNGSVLFTAVEQPVNGTSGIVSDFFIGSDAGAYSASDFELTSQTTLASIYTPGFDNSNSLATQPAITWQVYADAGGVPAGDPEDGASSFIWSYTAAPGDPEVQIVGSEITLDLVVAGESVQLDPGTYWLTVFPSYNVTGAGGARWNWYQAALVGAQTHLVSPVVFGVADWTPLTNLGVTFSDTAFTLTGALECGAPWLSVDPLAGTVAPDGSTDLTVTFDPTGLTPGVYEADVCIASNDPATPLLGVPASFTVEALPTDPTAVGAASPDVVVIGGSSILTVEVTPGQNPTSTGISVTADLTAIGGDAAQAFVDDGSGDDATAGDNIFTFTATIGAATTPGAVSLPVSVIDDQARTAATSIALTAELAPTDPTAIGAATPNVVVIGGSSIFTVEVTPGQNPTSTGIAVTADLTAIGGDAAQAFVDDGSGDDAVAGDNIFTFTATIGAATTAGAVSLPVSVLDDQARTAATTIDLTAQPADDFIFGDGFESD